MAQYKLAVFGSRTLADDRIVILIKEEIKNYKDVIIVTAGEPDGVCRIAQKVAREMSLPLRLYFLNCEKYARGAFNERSKLVLNDCDSLLIIWNGKSKGSSNEIELAKKMGVKTKLEILRDDDEFEELNINTKEFNIPLIQ